ncbi:MAG: hypothetical protein HRT88_15130 [Lentisphaeraceae bacterium]|nr:hypothetical protein [Lentisphaeraceae bacterium]
MPKCSVCKSTLTGKYKIANDKKFCSDKCLSTILPKCALCKAPCRQGRTLENKTYCVRCAVRPRCFSCSHPVGNGQKHADGRAFCETCVPNLLFDVSVAKQLYSQAIKEHEKLSGKRAQSTPPLNMVNLLEMKKKHPVKEADGMSLRGYYNVLERRIDQFRNGRKVGSKIKKVGESIYIVDGLQKEDFLVTAVHELTHDWLSDYYPGIKVAPLWVEEGCCQYLAYTFCLNKNYKNLARQIKNSKDKVYGEGFRFYLKKFGSNNWRGVQKWMLSKGYKKTPPVDAKRPSY